MPNLQKLFYLSDKGYSDLKKAILACALTNFSLMIPFTVIIQIIIELIKPLGGQEISWQKMWILFGFGILGAIVVFIANKNDYKKTYVTSYLESEKARINIAEQIRKLPMSVFNSKDLSELTTNIMADCTTTEHVLSHVIPQIFANFISLFVICIMLAFFDWRMALCVFCSVPIAFLVIYFSRKLRDRLGKKHVEKKLEASDKVQEYIEGIKVIKACNMDGKNFSKLEKALRDMKDISIKFEFTSGIFVTLAQVIVQAGMGITVFVGANFISKGKIDFIPYLMFLLIVTRIYGPILVELTLLPELFYHQISIKRMRSLMEVEIMGGDETPIEDYNIALETVNFSYNDDDKKAISNVTVEIPTNALTALVGPSGSGKSTVSRLIARFWDVNGGKVIIGGKDIKTINPEHLMSYMAFVFQDVVLFNDTVFNNIKVGNPEATDEEIYKAAKASCCDEFIKRLPNGYNTILGENGSTLSGGERQRLSIARALLKDAPIVLLDEATASLDPENESLIQKAISKLINGKTVIVIAHRLRTIKGAKKIIVLDEGKLVEAGNHDELIEKDGLYKKLYTIQQESIGWSV